MKELNKAREEAKKIIDLSDEFIVITPYGASIYCNGKAHLMAMICAYLKGQQEKGILSDEEIEEIVRVSKLEENDLLKETERKMEEVYKKIEKMDSKEFLDFIKEILD